MPEIHTIFTHDMGTGAEGELGIDNAGTLYWNKKAVVTEQKIKLEWWVKVSIILASISTFIMAVFVMLDFFGFGCKN